MTIYKSLIYNLAVKHMVDEMYYPKDISHFHYDSNFAIRGLYYDYIQGNYSSWTICTTSLYVTSLSSSEND